MPKKEKPTAKCMRCGDDFTLWPKNRKYCGGCQVLRDLRNGISKRDCPMCGDEFWPIRFSHKECYLCSNWRPERPEKYPKCSQCDRHFRPAPGTTQGSVCMHCVSSSEEMRDRYHRSLRRRVALRRKEDS